MANKDKPAAKPKKVETVNPATGEIVTEEKVNVPAVPAFSSKLTEVTLPGGIVVKLKKQVTQSVLRHPQNSTVFFTVTGAHYTGKEIKRSKMAPAELVPVIDVVTGRECVYIVPAVLLSEWTDNYPNNNYIGKSFAVFKGEKGQGKNYVDLSIAEIDVQKPSA